MHYPIHHRLRDHWQTLSRHGTQGLDYVSARRVMLVNQFCAIAIALNIVYAGQVIILDAAALSVFLWLVLIACLAFVGVMLLNGTRHQRLARWILSSIPVTTLFISAYFISGGAGLQLYLIVIWTLLFLIYTRREWIALLFFSIVYWLGFLTIEFWFVTPALDYDFPAGLIEQIHALSVTGTFLAVALVVGLFFTEIHRAERRLQEEFEHSENLLRNILPASIAERLKNQSDTGPLPANRSQTEDRPAPIADGHVEATVLFADLVGFTPLSSRLPPAALVQLLNEIFCRFDDIVLMHGLEKIKTIGDAYMLVGGLPEARGDHAQAVARAALEMQALMPQLRLPADNVLQLRIGIHSGPVVAGVIGRHKFAYDIWGETVNLASRLESHGQPGRIHVSQPLAELLGDEFSFEDRGDINIKGIGPTRTSFLLGKTGAGPAGLRHNP